MHHLPCFRIYQGSVICRDFLTNKSNDMNAKEARDKSLSINTSESNRQYQSVLRSIATAVNKGAYECWHYDTINADLRKKLEDDGYTVGAAQSDRDGICTKISW